MVVGCVEEKPSPLVIQRALGEDRLWVRNNATAPHQGRARAGGSLSRYKVHIFEAGAREVS